jgi:25S rRNA (adenine2142-N1)-methyltransferase
VLVDWLKPALKVLKGSSDALRVLEVGALSTENAISKAKNCHVTRIDLHSQEKGVLQQDFMERPVPATDEEGFHVLSLSLVLNYVPDATGRGDMLRRTTEFLCHAVPENLKTTGRVPCLFLVLPAACVMNSRYLTDVRLEEMLGSIGYDVIAKKVSLKLVYYLLHFDPNKVKKTLFKKQELRPGGQRNNFAIILR